MGNNLELKVMFWSLVTMVYLAILAGIYQNNHFTYLGVIGGIAFTIFVAVVASDKEIWNK